MFYLLVLCACTHFHTMCVRMVSIKIKVYMWTRSGWMWTRNEHFKCVWWRWWILTKSLICTYVLHFHLRFCITSSFIFNILKMINNLKCNKVKLIYFSLSVWKVIQKLYKKRTDGSSLLNNNLYRHNYVFSYFFCIFTLH